MIFPRTIVALGFTARAFAGLTGAALFVALHDHLGLRVYAWLEAAAVVAAFFGGYQFGMKDGIDITRIVDNHDREAKRCKRCGECVECNVRPCRNGLDHEP